MITGRVPSPSLKAAKILLAKAGPNLNLLLSKPFLPPQPGEILANQLAHIHAPEDRDLHTLSLSTIVFKEPDKGHRTTEVPLNYIEGSRSG